MTAESTQHYYRKDQSSGITAPNLAKCCSYAEHIVSARGKRDQYIYLMRESENPNNRGTLRRGLLSARKKLENFSLMI
jgi:hypothetical protein